MVDEIGGKGILGKPDRDTFHVGGREVAMGKGGRQTGGKRGEPDQVTEITVERRRVNIRKRRVGGMTVDRWP